MFSGNSGNSIISLLFFGSNNLPPNFLQCFSASLMVFFDLITKYLGRLLRLFLSISLKSSIESLSNSGSSSLSSSSIESSSKSVSSSLSSSSSIESSSKSESSSSSSSVEESSSTILSKDSLGSTTSSTTLFFNASGCVASCKELSSSAVAKATRRRPRQISFIMSLSLRGSL